MSLLHEWCPSLLRRRYVQETFTSVHEMNDAEADCVKAYLSMEDGCDKLVGMNASGNGSPFILSLSEVGCGSGDGGMLNSVEMFVRAGENVGMMQCGQRAAQMLCEVAAGVHIDDPAIIPGNKSSASPPRAPHFCFCHARQQCIELVTPHIHS